MNVAVTGMGVHCAIGANVNEMWTAIEKGECGIMPITNRFDVSQFDTYLGAMVPSGENYENDEERLLNYGLIAAEEAIDQSGLNDRSRIALISGTSNGLLGKDIPVVGTKLHEMLKIGGPALNISTACTSSTHAIALAADLIKHGEFDVALAGGLDVLTIEVFAGFHRLGLLSEKPCAPFSKNIGTTLGEGAAFLLLESEKSAENRGVKSLSTILGSWFSADAFHDTKPDPKGMGMARAVKTAIRHSGIEPGEVHYFNAHGTATAANDSSEWNAIQRVFGNRSGKLPVSSSKGHYGHIQGGAGAIEVITTIQGMSKGVVPPTLNLVETRPNVPNDPIIGNKPRKQQVDYAVCTNAAFGGDNAALVLGKSRNGTTDSITRSNRIGICGMGQARNEEQLEKFVPIRELRGLDISAKYLGGAIAASLTEANIRLRSPQCINVGLFVGQERISNESYIEFMSSIETRGIRHLSANAFTRMVVNYATGACSRLFELKGPTTTLATDNDSGLAALVLSAHYMSWDVENNQFLAAAVDEPRENDYFGPQAASVLLKKGDKNDNFYLSGWSLGNDSKTAVSRALVMSGLKAGDVCSIPVEGDLACSGLNAIISTIKNAKNNGPGPFLINNQRKGTVGAAVIIEKNVNNAA